MPDDDLPVEKQLPLSAAPLIGWGLAWAVVGLLLALAAPWLTWAPAWVQTPLNFAAPLLTLGFIAANLMMGVRLVGMTGRTLSALPLTLTQLVLFTLLFFQIACHFGAGHFRWKENPEWWEWLWFSAAHGLRAGDLLDAIEAYDLHLQNIRHASQTTAICLVLYHLIMDLFLISLLLEGFGWVRRVLTPQPKEEASVRRSKSLKWRLIVYGLGSLLVGFAVAWVRTFSRLSVPADQTALWFLSNTLRVLDFTDAFDIYKVRIHQIPQDSWMATLEVWYRLMLFLVCGSLLSRLGRAVRLKWLGGWGMKPDELQEVMEYSSSEPIRQIANARWRQITARGVKVMSGWKRFFLAGTMGGVVCAVLACLSPPLPWWREAAEALAKKTSAPNGADAVRALAELTRMGEYAESVLPVLEQGLPQVPRERLEEYLSAIGAMGPEAAGTLEKCMAEDDPERAVWAAEASRPLGMAAFDLWYRVAGGRDERVSRAARAELRRLGEPAIRPLAEKLERETKLWVFDVLDEIHPRWWELLRTTLWKPGEVLDLKAITSMEDRWIKTLLEAMEPVAVLRGKPFPGGRGMSKVQAIPALLYTKGTGKANWRMALIRSCINDPDPNLRRAACLPLLARELQKHPDVLKVALEEVAKPIEKDRRDLMIGLRFAGPAAAPAIPILIEQLRKAANDEAAMEITGTLGSIGPAAKDAIPLIVERMQKLEKQIGFPPDRRSGPDPTLDRKELYLRSARSALKQIDPDWEKK